MRDTNGNHFWFEPEPLSLFRHKVSAMGSGNSFYSVFNVGVYVFNVGVYVFNVGVYLLPQNRPRPVPSSTLRPFSVGSIGSDVNRLARVRDQDSSEAIRGYRT
jgi:hypothetical protein